MQPPISLYVSDEWLRMKAFFAPRGGGGGGGGGSGGGANTDANKDTGTGAGTGGERRRQRRHHSPYNWHVACGDYATN